MGAVYACGVRIIARGTLNGFVQKRVEPLLRKLLQEQLDAWYAVVSRSSWRNSGELKQQFGTASVITAERVVFNIRGNEFRLVVAVDYAHGFVLILWIGTHGEYDGIDVKTVKFEKERYADSTGSK